MKKKTTNFYFKYFLAIILSYFLGNVNIYADGNPSPFYPYSFSNGLFACPTPHIRYTNIAPDMDASTIDACWSTAMVGTFDNVTVGAVQPDFTGSQWRALYDNNYIYILAEVRDTVLRDDSGGNWWNDDGVEIFIDGDNSKGADYDGVNDFQYFLRYSGDTVIVGTRSVNDTTGVRFDQYLWSDGKGYNIEVRIPWSTIGITPAAGNSIGFDISVDDDDNVGGDTDRDAQVAWNYTTNIAWDVPSVFGTLQFCDEDPEVTINQAGGQSDPTNSFPIYFDVHFSEKINGFTFSDITWSGNPGGISGTLTTTGDSIFRIVLTAAPEIALMPSIPANCATNDGGLNNQASTSTDNTVTYDITAPSITSFVRQTPATSPTNANSLIFRVTFSEDVSNVGTADFAVNSISTTTVTNVAAVTGTSVYDVTVSGGDLASFNATLGLNLSGGQDITDIAGNALPVGEPSTDETYTLDNTAPSVTLEQAGGQTDPTNSSPINFTVIFSEPVTGFATGDVALSGTAGAATATVTGSGATYNIAVSGMTGSGTVIATIGANVCTDEASNNNMASTSTDNTVTYDNTAPGVTVEQAVGQIDPINSSPINFTVTFSEAVTGFATGDVTLGGTAGATTATVTGSGATYNIAVSGMTGSGTVIASIAANVCTDASGNGNTASTSTDNSVTFNLSSPTVEITQAVGQTDPTNGTTINFTATFSEAVTGFDATDVNISNTGGGSASATVTGTGPYNIAISGYTGTGTITITIPANSCTNGSGINNTASINTDNSVDFDLSAPTVEITQAVGQTDPTNGTTINFTATFSEAVTGFDASDVNITNTGGGTASATVTGTDPYNIAISGYTGTGTITIAIPANSCSNASGNGNTASINTDNSVIYDLARPDVVISSTETSPTSSDPIPVTIEFSTAIVGFANSDINLTNATITSFTEEVAGIRWQLNVQAISYGTITIQVPADIAQSVVGNNNNESNIFTIEYNSVNNAPLIENQVFTIDERMPAGTTIGNIIASDPDGDAIVFSIVSGNVDNAFELDQSTGELTVSNSIAVDFYVNPIFTLTVQVEDDNVESLSTQAEVEVRLNEVNDFQATNIITPNSLNNRYWIVTDVERYYDYELVIRNNTGQIVYKTTNYQNDWNGTYNNKPLPTGTYYYFLTNATRNRVYKGFINIIYE